MLSPNELWEKALELRNSKNFKKRIDICRDGIDRSKVENEYRRIITFSAELAAALLYWENSVDRKNNIEEAITIYKALKKQVSKAENEEKTLGIAFHGLGNAYYERLNGEKIDNLKQSLYYCNEGLKIYKNLNGTITCGRIMVRMSRAFSELSNLTGNNDNDNDNDNAIKYAEQAHQIFYDRKKEFECASVEMLLWRLYRSKKKGNRISNLNISIKHYKNASSYFNKENDPENYAILQEGIAIAYREKADAGNKKNLISALDYYKSSLAVFKILNLADDIQRVSKSIKEIKDNEV
ncbi:MAG: hypothetical protein GY777_15730 [Candidatus Brocadiaceae bacterium]|nr:hypothetical protein [Candidatus Brocadiaceae bacterium]